MSEENLTDAPKTDISTESTPTTESNPVETPTPAPVETPPEAPKTEPIATPDQKIEGPVNATEAPPEPPKEEKKVVEPPYMPARYTYDVYHVDNPHNPVFEIIAEEDYPGKISAKVYKVVLLTADDPKKYTLTLRRIEVLNKPKIGGGAHS